jgi:hypothetical protein
VLLPCLSGRAAAYETEVTAHSDFQYYAVRSPFGSPELRQQRYTQTLGLGLYDLQGAPDPRRARWLFVSRLRLDTDFGQQDAERDPNAPSRFVPGLRQAPLQLMYGYLEGRNLSGGWLGMKLGRQYVVNSLGWWSFDGATVSVTTPVFLGFDAYGGFEQRGGLPLLSTSRFSADGVYRGSRNGLETGQWPSYLEESAVAPAYGATLRSAGVSWLRARLDWRKVMNRDRALVTPFVDPTGHWEIIHGNRVSSERVGGSAELFDTTLGNVSLGAVYDFYAQAWSERQAAVDWYATGQWVLGAAYEYYLPVFDGDSIFNWFSHQGMTLWSLRSSVAFSRAVELSSSCGVRRFTTVSADGEAVNDLTGSLGSTYRWASGTTSVRGIGEAGRGGHLVGGDASTRHLFAGGYYDTLFILSLYDWRDALRPTDDATSFTYVLGGGIHPGGITRIGLEWEHTANRLVGQRFRLVGTLDLEVLR